MGLDDIRAALADALGTVDGLQAYERVPGQVNPPAAVVAPDSISYDATFDGGATYRLPVQFLSSLGDWESAQKELDAFVSHDSETVAMINDSEEIEARVVEMSEYGLTVFADKNYLGAVLIVEVLA